VYWRPPGRVWGGEVASTGGHRLQDPNIFSAAGCLEPLPTDTGGQDTGCCCCCCCCRCCCCCCCCSGLSTSACFGLKEAAVEQQQQRLLMSPWGASLWKVGQSVLTCWLVSSSSAVPSIVDITGNLVILSFLGRCRGCRAMWMLSWRGSEPNW
jgi:hypothetical protein